MIFLPFFFTNGWIFRGGNFNRVSAFENFEQNWEQIYLMKSEQFFEKDGLCFRFLREKRKKKYYPWYFHKAPPSYTTWKETFRERVPTGLTEKESFNFQYLDHRRCLIEEARGKPLPASILLGWRGRT